MKKSRWVVISVSIGLLVAFLVVGQFLITSGQNSQYAVEASQPRQEDKYILVDDFEPQPLMEESVWFYNRLSGDRGQIDGWWDPSCSCSQPGGGHLMWGQGAVTATITQTQGSEAWVGAWTSLNHVITENIPLNFSAIFPQQILGAYQGSVTRLRMHILDGSGLLEVKLQAPDLTVVWSYTTNLVNGAQIVDLGNLPAGDIRNLNWIVKGQVGDFVVVDKVELEVSVPQLTIMEQAFLWNYSMLLANWDATSGLTRDRASFPAGDFDNVSASGLQAAVAVQALRLEMISENSARQIVNQTTASLLSLPDCHGLWPHFVTDGQITDDTEWSSVDTVIAMMALIEANQALGLEANAVAVAQALQQIEWDLLVMPSNQISHGFDTNCTSSLSNTWYDFGTETWLANFGYAAATGNVADMDATPPTYNGSGFIDELAWLFLPAPDEDRWGIQWNTYRSTAADEQIAYYTQSPHPCYAPYLFGLSAAEVPDPSIVPQDEIYQAFGIGGEIPANDGMDLLGHAVLIPHYPAMISVLRPQEAVIFWLWLEEESHFSPLNNVESLMFIDEPPCMHMAWNSLKGSWNLGLQTIGWGNYLLEHDNPLYQAMWDNEFLRDAYYLFCKQKCHLYLPVVKNGDAENYTPPPTDTPAPTNTSFSTPPAPTNTPTLTPPAPTNTPTSTPPAPTNTPTLTPPAPTDTPTLTPPAPTDIPTNTPAPPWPFEREAEFPDEFTVGSTISRSNACEQQVHGQFGTTGSPPFSAQSGYVKYVDVEIPEIMHAYLWLRYSKDSIASVPIEVYIDDEIIPRTTFIPPNQGSWNAFTWTPPIDLGNISGGIHSVKFYTNGQQYGVADLDKFILSDSILIIPDC